MRKRIRILIFAAIVAAIVVPVGFALSLDSKPHATALPVAARLPVAAVADSPSFMATSTAFAVTTSAALPEMPDAVKLFAVGTVLCGLAAAMRRTC